MGKEIEKKFLIADNSWQGLGVGKAYSQGYLNSEKGRTVRVRIIGDRGFLTIKGPNDHGARLEYEYDIPVEDAREMLDLLCQKPLIEKIRYCISFAGFIWEVDDFKGENEGLLIAEIELEYVGQEFSQPSWIGPEVTGDSRYYNANLVKNPYSTWKA
ncbi:MAG: CYTH domain-containing protein [Proteobacteria bacterium]|nr:CYTH domain-containing protein [Pseudomonadota bacterium]